MDGWEIERLDLGAYLERVGFAGDPRPDAATLIALHRAHVTAIPFENLDVVLGRGVSLDLGDMQAKMVRGGRGGYCYEHGLLFAAALERIGFPLRRLVARVSPRGESPGPRTHMLSRVEVGGEPWLADVGFGGGVLEPFPMAPGEVEQEGWRYALVEDAGGWRLQARYGEESRDLYGFTLEPQIPVDYVVANHYISTHPRSPFTGQVVTMRHAVDRRHRVRGLELTTERPDGSVETRRLSPDERGRVLRETFRIALSDEELSALRDA